MDRGLLLSLMALEKEFVTPQQFLSAFEASVSNRLLKLEEISIQRGFLTKSQLQRLATALDSKLESVGGQWQQVLLPNNSIGIVYDDMLKLAAKNSSLLSLVQMIGQAMNKQPASQSPLAKQLRVDTHADREPHSTVCQDGHLDPYATITQPFDENS